MSELENLNNQNEHKSLDSGAHIVLDDYLDYVDSVVESMDDELKDFFGL